jgi:hypothetical protein
MEVIAMPLDPDRKLPDEIPDAAGMLLRSLNRIPTWTGKKFELFAEFERLAKRERYLKFKADRRDYHLERKGDHCLYDVPIDRRGALKRLAGQRIRLVCGGSLNPYSDRIFFAKKIDRTHVYSYEILGSVVEWPVEVYLGRHAEQAWTVDVEYMDPEARTSVSYTATTAADFLGIAEESNMDLDGFIKALQSAKTAELRALGAAIENG